MVMTLELKYFEPMVEPIANSPLSSFPITDISIQD